ncbi:MAG: lipopolysaccharide biosynthesis protein [bacterium]
MTNNLKEKAIKGVSWNMIEQFSVQGVKFILGIILARLLTPADFGLIGMISVFFAVANVFIQGGLGIAYIQKETVTDTDANTVFFTNLIISIGLYSGLWFGAPAISSFYEQPQLVLITRIMGLVVIINAFNIIQLSQIKRNVDFKKKTKITLLSTIISGSLGVLAAYYGMGVWSLVIQQLTDRFVSTLILSITNKWNPSLKFSINSLKTMFSVGIWELLSGIVQTIFQNIYILTIGKFFPAAQLGFYTKAKQLKNLASQQLTGSVGSVSFPVLSRLQNDKIKLKNAMRKFIQYSLILTVPAMMVMIVSARPFVLLALTEKWSPMIPYLQLMCIAGFLYPIHVVNLQVLTALGHTRLGFNLNVVKNILRIINISIMYRWGVIYIIYGELILSLISLILNTYYTKWLIGYGFIKQIKDIYKIVFIGFVAGGLSLWLNSYIENLWINFAFAVLSSLGLFVCLQVLFNFSLVKNIYAMRSIFIKNK